MRCSIPIVISSLRAKRSNPWCPIKKEWIASSRSLSSGAHSRDPLAPRNDEKLKHHAFVLQQPALSLQPAAIFDPRAVGADQAMTGDHYADRIGAIGVADRAHRVGCVKFRRQRAIAHRRSGGDFWQRVPDLLLEWRAGHAPSDRGQASEIAFEIG